MTSQRRTVRLRAPTPSRFRLRGFTHRGFTHRGFTLRGSTLRGSTLRGITLRGSTLRGIMFRDTTLRGTTLRGQPRAQGQCSCPLRPDPSSSRSRRSRPRTPPRNGHHDWHEAGDRSRRHDAHSAAPDPPTQHARGEAGGTEEGDVERADHDAEPNSQSSATKRPLLTGGTPPRRQAPDEQPSPGSAKAQANRVLHPGTCGRRQAAGRPRRPSGRGCADGRTTGMKRS